MTDTKHFCSLTLGHQAYFSWVWQICGLRKMKASTFSQRNKGPFEKKGTLWALPFLISALLKGSIVTSPAFCPPRSQCWVYLLSRWKDWLLKASRERGGKRPASKPTRCDLTTRCREVQGTDVGNESSECQCLALVVSTTAWKLLWGLSCLAVERNDQHRRGFLR